ncbi:hypothetical protein LZ30DRAFT_724423 [Colletotrichum cereale]|nr:hypothetical protein LZ30DRAFT_724423 [Colletotrichum cereale]
MGWVVNGTGGCPCGCEGFSLNSGGCNLPPPPTSLLLLPAQCLAFAAAHLPPESESGRSSVRMYFVHSTELPSLLRPASTARRLSHALHPHLPELLASLCTVHSAQSAFRYSDPVISCHASTALLCFAYLTLPIDSTIVLCCFAGLPCLFCPGPSETLCCAFPFPFPLRSPRVKSGVPLAPLVSRHLHPYDLLRARGGGTRWATRERYPLLAHPCPAATPAPTCRATYTHVGLHTHTHTRTHTHTQRSVTMGRRDK